MLKFSSQKFSIDSIEGFGKVEENSQRTFSDISMALEILPCMFNNNIDVEFSEIEDHVGEDRQ